MLDISVGVLALKQVKSIYIVAIKNEVKELLFHQKKGFEGRASIHTINRHPKADEHFSFELSHANCPRIGGKSNSRPKKLVDLSL